MHHTKLEDHRNGVTTSRSGNKFKFESPIPGVHIYDTNWTGSSDFFEKISTDAFWENEATVNDVKWVREDYLDEDTGKKSSSCWLHYSKEMEDAFGEIVDSYLFHWNVDPHSREKFRITKFEGTGEFFGMHSDDSFATPRTVSMVYYATENYSGGELEFIHFGVKIKPRSGQLFLFPSGYSYEHKVHPVTGGDEPRITVVSFFNQMTNDERMNRVKYINPNEYYTPDWRYVLSEDFPSTKWPEY